MKLASARKPVYEATKPMCPPRRDGPQIATASRYEIAVENSIGGAHVAGFDQIHQQEGEIVKQIARGNHAIEFQRIEGDRLASNDRDVPEVKVAVAAADQSLSAPFDEQWTQPRQRGHRLALQIRCRLRREQLGVLAKDEVLLWMNCSRAAIHRLPSTVSIHTVLYEHPSMSW
jgi:hypothetical protein